MQFNFKRNFSIHRSTSVSMASSSQQEPHPLLYPYNDNDSLPAVDDKSNDGGDAPQVRIEAIPHYLALDASASISSLYVLIKLTAPPTSEFRQDLRHAPIDLVIVLDSSECSFDDSYMAHIKEALHFVIQNLGPFDRLSIVSFANQARRILPLRAMNNRGRKAAAAAAESIVVEGGSGNPAEGLKQGSRVLEERPYNDNPYASIILLSHTQQAWPICEKHLRFPIHAFGIGRDHDAVAMHAASDKSKGSYMFLKSYGAVLGAISSCIGGLFSVVAQDLCVTVAVTSPIEIKEAYTGGFKRVKSRKNSQVTIYAGDFYADQKKEFVVRIAIPRLFRENIDEFGKAPLVNIVCLYNDVVTQLSVVVKCPLLELDRPTATFLREMLEILRRIGTLERYKAGGRAYMLSTISSLKFQKATTRGDRLQKEFTTREKAFDECEAAPKKATKMKDSFIIDGNRIENWMVYKL
ncbi:E3 ubiquitin-protein ligase WAV3-like [Andrographis paniculata]|uniref:E3 ubiquitin-protein ligase WAV3-like n=1 Tax=Andrographis paniculata TaxID=175694 RepID=UPI0021E76609|nr:E3 ubiquitin-protein ligase WAV3-like [Andrographis paniculata]